MCAFNALMGAHMVKRSLCVWGLTAPYAPCISIRVWAKKNLRDTALRSVVLCAAYSLPTSASCALTLAISMRSLMYLPLLGC